MRETTKCDVFHEIGSVGIVGDFRFILIFATKFVNRLQM